MTQEKTLALLSASEYTDKAHAGYPVTCPTLDLSATWETHGRNLLICRPPSQIVSKIHQVGAPGQKAPEAQAVTWRPDGQFLAVGWSDGFVRLMGLENNKAAHHIQVTEAPETKITHIGWASCTISDNENGVSSKRNTNGIFKEMDLGGDRPCVDLPRELTFLEVDTALPKLSPLPTSSAGPGEDASVFTLRTGIEFLFQPPKPEGHDRVDVMVVGTSEGSLMLSIHDSFIIGTLPCPVPVSSAPLQLVQHASHPLVPTQALVLAEKPEGPDEVHLVPMDLPFISSSPINLSLLTSKLTTLQKLLRYLHQTQLHMQVEWKNTRELPTRFLRSVQGDLEDLTSGPRDIVAALYHTVVTGHAHGPVREWLVDSLAERGHKRWDKAVVSGLENLRSLVHENFLPALDRFAVVLSRLRGLAQFYDTRDDIGFSVAQITRVMDIISCLNLIGHKILVCVMDELEHFTAFSTWMRLQIDRFATSSGADEVTEKEATMDHGKVLTYVERYLTESPLRIFFDEIEKEDYTADWEHIEDGPSLLDVLQKQLAKFEKGQPSMKALPHVDFLVNYVTSRSNGIFKNIAEAKKRSVRFGKPIKLSVGQPISQMDTRVCRSNETVTMMTALTSKDTSKEESLKGIDRLQVRVFSIGLDIVNGISSNLPPKFFIIDLGQRNLIDFKFLNDDALVVLCAEKGAAPKALCVAISPASFADSTSAEPTRISADDFTEYCFPQTPVVRPVRMEVHERSDVRGDIPARMCLLESNRTTLRTFAIPTQPV